MFKLDLIPDDFQGCDLCSKCFTFATLALVITPTHLFLFAAFATFDYVNIVLYSFLELIYCEHASPIKIISLQK